MSRFGSEEEIAVKPGNTVYTVLTALATLIAVGGLWLFYLRMDELGVSVLPF
ncbi:MAG: hypothetical protein ACFCVE_12825 [Phycisphaerae bacterium]